jgi:hypothetical protein
MKTQNRPRIEANGFDTSAKEAVAMTRLRFSLVCSVLSLLACADGAPDESVDTLTFETSADALTWLASKTPAHPGTRVLYGTDGSVQTILFDDTAARDSLFEELKRFKVIWVAGKAFDAQTASLVSDQDAASDTEVRRSPLTSTSTACDRGLCVAGESIHRRYTLLGIGYHEVGGWTSITSGATKHYYCPSIVGWAGLKCAPPYSLVFDPEYITRCRGGANTSGRSCVWKTGTQQVGLRITYFTNAPGVSTPLLTEDLLLNDYASFGKTYMAFGTKSLACVDNPTLACAVDGVCAHSSARTTTSTSSLFATVPTAAGSQTCQ